MDTVSPDINPSHVAGLKAGDENALKQLLDLLGPKLLNYCKRQGMRQPDAEEILQDVFLKLWQFRERLETGTNFEAFIFTITRRQLLNVARKRLCYDLTPTGELADNIPDTAASLFTSGSYDQVYRQYLRILQQADTKRREVFLLSREEGLSHKQIAEKLNIPLRTVEYYIAEMLKTLRTELKDHYVLLVLFLFR